MTNVNSGSSRWKPTGKPKNAPEADFVEADSVDASARRGEVDFYEPADDGAFAEAYEEYYDEAVVEDPAPRGRHSRPDAPGEEDSPVFNSMFDSGARRPETRGGSAAAGAAGAAGVAGAASAAGDIHDAEFEEVVEVEDDPRVTQRSEAAPAAAPVRGEAPRPSRAEPIEYSEEYEEYPEDDQPRGIPKRGLAMVLIAVAVLLGLWGLYALTQGNKDVQNTANDPGQTGQTVPTGAPAPGQSQAPGQDPNAPKDDADHNRDSQNRAPKDGREGDRREAGREGEGGNRGSIPAGEKMTADNEKINVYNNSTVSGLAADVADNLRGQGTEVGGVGNFNAETLEQTTVFFDPNTPGAEERARILADRVGGIARANIESLPEEAKKPDTITLIMVGPVEL
ncbi:LytR C-terminal domain-containing protein [Corynebacterium aquatimens]|uniref:LytR/CpsA/Psr regulator C-terminal domain-containing protein n=1 Tax=Corynebacterium aquatimens TaxID=1190508 RepID=A0A931E2I2_9CORY|nr:LytR C-terminal domain-containing protein [Corynebacterium aquatimens]MBG6122380.1 hypothetical protein [Corynebacterium aquatimens]